MSGDCLHDRLAIVERELAWHRDLRAIEDVLTLYSRALDWLDDAAIESVFWDDAEIDYGFFKGSGKDFKPLLMDLEHRVGRRWHFTAQVKIALDGDMAEVESYNFTIAAEKIGFDESSPLMQFYGTYIDRFERREGRWGIVRRRHLLVGGAFVPEAAMVGEFAELNQIGEADPRHPEFRRLAS